jgi:inactivated superfamily I helicase
VRRADRPGTKLHIYGPLESRLMQADRIIVGGLIEGVWPPAPRIDPWLSRPMRHELGLDLPERRIGLSAHDFAQLLGHDDVILSHSSKAGGAPAVARRGQAHCATRTATTPRDTAVTAIRNPDRGLAPRSLHDLCASYPRSAAARSR